MIHMKCQLIFSLSKRKEDNKSIKMASATNLASRVNLKCVLKA